MVIETDENLSQDTQHLNEEPSPEQELEDLEIEIHELEKLSQRGELGGTERLFVCFPTGVASGLLERLKAEKERLLKRESNQIK